MKTRRKVLSLFYDCFWIPPFMRSLKTKPYLEGLEIISSQCDSHYFYGGQALVFSLIFISTKGILSKAILRPTNKSDESFECSIIRLRNSLNMFSSMSAMIFIAPVKTRPKPIQSVNLKHCTRFQGDIDMGKRLYK